MAAVTAAGLSLSVMLETLICGLDLIPCQHWGSCLQSKNRVSSRALSVVWQHLLYGSVLCMAVSIDSVL